MDMEIFESGKKKLRVQKYLDTCGLGLRMNRMHRTQFEHSRLDLLSLDPAWFDNLSRETCAKHSVAGAKAF